MGKTPNVQEKHGVLPLRLDLRFNCKVKGLVRTNPNKFVYLVCVWVKTHIKMVFEEIHDRSLK